MKYYKVKCKFGHVGRNMYLPLLVPVIASNIKEASILARQCGGVKRDHADWCLEKPVEINEIEFNELLVEFRNDQYWEGKTKKNIKDFKHRLIEEPNFSNHRGMKTNKKKFFNKVDIDIKLFKLKKMQVIINQLTEGIY